MIVVYTKHGERIEVANGAAVVATTMPMLPSAQAATPAAALAVVTASGETLAVFRQNQLVGYDVASAGTDA